MNLPEKPDISNSGPDSAASQAQELVGQTVDQTGKYGVALGQGSGDIHIGDRIYQIDQETLRRIVKDELWSTEYRRDTQIIKTILREELRLMHKEYGTAVSLGLNALSDLLKEPEVHESVNNFRRDFQAARDRIHVISQLKELHDLLHNIEILCYLPITREAKGFPDNELAVDNLSLHHLKLQNHIERIRAVRQRSSQTVETFIWLTQLENAEETLDEAISTLDSHKLRQTISQLHRIIANQPTRINTQLNQAARVLRLSDLIESMAAIQRKLSDADVNSQKVKHFAGGIEALTDLENRLAVLVISHDYWQAMDMDLRLIETNLDYSQMELEVAWPDLKNRVKPWFDEHQDRWTTLFQRDSQNLDAAIAENNPAKIKKYFRLYRGRALERFYQVDVTLKRLCDELSKVGEHLATVLEALD